MAGNCITNTGSLIPLLDPYTVPISGIEDFQPAFPTSSDTLPQALRNAQLNSYTNSEYSSFLSDAYSSLRQAIGYEGCAATLPPSQVYPTYIGEQGTTSETAIPLVSAVETPGPSPRAADYTRTIIVSVVVPITTLVIILLCFVVIRIRRKKRSQAASTESLEKISDVQLYVDQKAELEDEERRRHELDAGGRTFEMEGVDGIFEMPGNGDMGTRSVRSDRVQELKGAEHSKELEAPSNI